MVKLYDLATVCRSKNAGPFQWTIDLMFADAADFERALTAPEFTVKRIADLYHVDAEYVAIKPFARIRTIKVVIPRRISSGAPEDTDVYGSQQHFPLGDLEIA